MIIDSSALLAIVFAEPESARFAEAISRSSIRQMSVVNWLESVMVAKARAGAQGEGDVRAALRDLDISLVSFDREQAREALEGWERFGKGRHPARLNLGDCCAYGTSVAGGEPLLFKGSDFAQTDVARAEW